MVNFSGGCIKFTERNLPVVATMGSSQMHKVLKPTRNEKELYKELPSGDSPEPKKQHSSVYNKQVSKWKVLKN